MTCLRLAVTIAALASTSCTTMPTNNSVEKDSVEKTIVHAAWTTADFSHEITEAFNCQAIGLLVATKGYQTGDPVKVTIIDKNAANFEVRLHGTVDADGNARISWPEGACEAAREAAHDAAPVPN